MLEKYCDILVIGTELPGLITAAFLARRGLTVQIVDVDLFADHPKKPDPQCLTNKQSKLLRSILGRLNVPEMTIQNFLKIENTLQVVFPRHRIDVLNDPLTYFEEIEREFDPYDQNVRQFYENLAKIRHQTDINELFQRLLPAGFKERRAFKKFIEEQGLNRISTEFVELSEMDHRLKTYLKLQFLLAAQVVCETPFSYQVAEFFNLGDGGLFSVHHNTATLKKMLLDRMIHYDGSVRKQLQIQKLLFRNGVFEGVQLNEHDSILSKYVIWNAPLNLLPPLLPPKWRFRKLRRLTQKFRYDFHWFTARYSVARDFVPDPMRSNVVIVGDPEKTLIGENFVYVQVSRSSLEPRARLDAHFLLPPSALDRDDSFYEPYFQGIEKRLKFVMPFCEKSLRREFPVAHPDQPDDTLFPLQENDFEIFRHSAQTHGVLNQNQKRFIDLFKLHYKTPAPNLFLSHPLIFRGFGLDAQLVLGLKITDLIWQEAEKVKKRAMRTERKIA